MYRSLLVPLDSTELSVDVVGKAVGLAHALGARVTFFHAIADRERSLHGDVEVLDLAVRAEPEFAADGRARELLSKAEAAARAFGVPCESLCTVNNQPADAIIAAARTKGCDLIFMASHGHCGRPHAAPASDTLAVLMNAGLPVLVSSTTEPGPPARAIAIIRDEHRALATVLHTWMHLLAQARARGGAADPVQMQTVVHYLQNFLVALHHPKEELHVFRRLRERTHAVDAELDELERQHLRDRTLVTDLSQRVEALAQATGETGRIAATRALEEAVLRYSDIQWDHMGREESAILPAAQRHLTEADWAAIDAAFTHDPGIQVGGEADRAYHPLIARIVGFTDGAGAALSH
jgi:nucleotide-binding universal stress UspA family protein/hemerythrin-like domain-containing protein